MPAVPTKDEYMQRCTCGDCETFKEFGMSKGYCCAEGSAEEIEA